MTIFLLLMVIGAPFVIGIIGIIFYLSITEPNTEGSTDDDDFENFNEMGDEGDDQS